MTNSKISIRGIISGLSQFLTVLLILLILYRNPITKMFHKNTFIMLILSIITSLIILTTNLKIDEITRDTKHKPSFWKSLLVVATLPFIIGISTMIAYKIPESRDRKLVMNTLAVFWILVYLAIF